MTLNDIVERYPIDVLEHAERVMNYVIIICLILIN